MKHAKKHLIAVVMDGVKDTDMMAGYAETARQEGEEKLSAWFAQRAKERLAALRRDWGDVESELKLHDHDDDLVEAMACHIDREIDRIRARVEKL